jgi:hypothetical protein
LRGDVSCALDIYESQPLAVEEDDRSRVRRPVDDLFRRRPTSDALRERDRAGLPGPEVADHERRATPEVSVAERVRQVGEPPPVRAEGGADAVGEPLLFAADQVDRVQPPWPIGYGKGNEGMPTIGRKFEALRPVGADRDRQTPNDLPVAIKNNESPAPIAGQEMTARYDGRRLRGPQASGSAPVERWTAWRPQRLMQLDHRRCGDDSEHGYEHPQCHQVSKITSRSDPRMPAASYGAERRGRMRAHT